MSIWYNKNPPAKPDLHHWQKILEQMRWLKQSDILCDINWICDTVDGWNPAPVDMVVYPTIYKVLYIPAGAGFLPSTVVCLSAYHFEAQQIQDMS